MWGDTIQFISAWLYEGFVFHPTEFEVSVIAAFVVAARKAFNVSDTNEAIGARLRAGRVA